jgi:hypothetical protein
MEKKNSQFTLLTRTSEEVFRKVNFRSATSPKILQLTPTHPSKKTHMMPVIMEQLLHAVIVFEAHLVFSLGSHAQEFDCCILSLNLREKSKTAHIAM